MNYVPSAQGLLVPDHVAKALQDREAEKLAKKIRAEEVGHFFSLIRRALGYSPILALEKPADEPRFTFLRRLARQSQIDKVIILTRVHQVKRVAQLAQNDDELGFRVVHDRHEDPHFSETESIRRRCREVEQLIANPWSVAHPTFRHAIIGAVKDELIIDRKAMVVTRGRNGRPVRWHLLDGATIKPRLEVLMPWMHKWNLWDPDKAAERLSYQTGIDLTGKAYVQEVDGQVVAAWEEGEMVVDITNPVLDIDHWGYGRSLLEESIEATDLFMRAMLYNSDLFRINYPESLVVIYGESDQQSLDAFKRQIMGQVGPQGSARLAFVEGGSVESGFKVDTHKLRDTPRDMLFTELIRMIIALKCAYYRLHPSAINFTADRGGGASIFEYRNEEQAITLSQEEGFHSLLSNIADWLTRALVKPMYPDLKLIWVGLDMEDEKTHVEIMERRVRTYMTVDEVRQAEGLDALPDGKGEVILDATWMQYQNLRQQAAWQEQQMAMMQQQQGVVAGDFGEEAEPGSVEQGEPAEAGQEPAGGQPAPVEKHLVLEILP